MPRTLPAEPKECSGKQRECGDMRRSYKPFLPLLLKTSSFQIPRGLLAVVSIGWRQASVKPAVAAIPAAEAVEARPELRGW